MTVGAGRRRESDACATDGRARLLPPGLHLGVDRPRIGAVAGGRVIPKLTSELLETLDKHSWPGNIRELKNVMERALTVCVGATLLPEHLIIEPDLSLDEAPQSTRSAGPFRVPPKAAPSAPTAAVAAREPHGRLLRMDAETEQKLILKALDQAGGNQSKASEILGISRRTLINRLDEYGLRRPRKKTDE